MPESSYHCKWRQVADRLLHDLAIEHPDLLPGLLTLSQRYGVSRGTLEQSLDYLESLGVVSPPSHGKPRRVHLPRLRKLVGRRSRKGGRIAFLLSDFYEEQNSTQRDFLRLCRGKLEAEGHKLELVSRPKRERDLGPMLQSLAPDAIILYAVPQEVIDIADRLKLRGVVASGSYQGGRYPSVGIDFAKLTADAFDRAWQAGHQRVSFLAWDMPVAMHTRLVSTISKVAEARGLPFAESYNLPIACGPEIDDFMTALEKLFKLTPPSCLILGNVSHLIMVFSFCLQRGIRIPQDLSLIVLNETRRLKYFRPSIAHYIHPTSPLAEQAVALVLRQLKGDFRVEQFLEAPRWQPGESLGQG